MDEGYLAPSLLAFPQSPEPDFWNFMCCSTNIPVSWDLACQGSFSNVPPNTPPRKPINVNPIHTLCKPHILGCPVVPLFPFWGGLGSLINPFKQKRPPFLSLGYWGQPSISPTTTWGPSKVSPGCPGSYRGVKHEDFPSLNPKPSTLNPKP